MQIRQPAWRRDRLREGKSIAYGDDEAILPAPTEDTIAPAEPLFRRYNFLGLAAAVAAKALGFRKLGKLLLYANAADVAGRQLSPSYRSAVSSTGLAGYQDLVNVRLNELVNVHLGGVIITDDSYRRG